MLNFIMLIKFCYNNVFIELYEYSRLNLIILLVLPSVVNVMSISRCEEMEGYLNYMCLKNGVGCVRWDYRYFY